MAIISIDNKEYDTDTLNEDAKGNVSSIQFIDAELLRINATVSVLKTAKMAYSKSLQSHLSGLTDNNVTSIN